MKQKCLLLLFLVLINLTACKKSEQSSSSDSGSRRKDSIEVLFTYGSEKEKWINEITEAFNKGERRTSRGNVIYVKAIPKGSGECIDDLLSGRTKAHNLKQFLQTLICTANSWMKEFMAILLERLRHSTNLSI